MDQERIDVIGRTLRLALIATTVLATAGPAAAGKGVPVEATGRTLAGPMTVEIPDGLSTRVWDDGAEFLRICQTTANVGKGRVEVEEDGVTWLVEPGESFANCKDYVERVVLRCLGLDGKQGVDCRVVWRADQQ